MSTSMPLVQDGYVAARTGRVQVSWTIWAGVLALTSATLGGAWDVAWHRSIGRDSFLTPAHLAIYACGIIAGIVCGYLILFTTFGRSARAEGMRAVSVGVLGFRAPLGAFIAAWGGIAMLTSAPFDNWWHNAYGLDVKIISPPHTLLILGIRAISVGIIFLILAAMNRTRPVAEDGALDPTYRTLEWLFLYMGGLMVVGQMFFLLEQTWDVALHTTLAYIVMGLAIPVVFALLSRTTRNPWAGTIAAGIYTVFALGEVLVLPLVPATPKLGPVFFPVTHLIPAKFPILILVPAIALDLLFRRTRMWKPRQIALAAGVLFTAVLFAVEWPFANFLLSKASENRFFGTIYFDYNARPNGFDRMREFYNPAHGFGLAAGLLIAAVCASGSSWFGLRFGSWMKGVQR